MYFIPINVFHFDLIFTDNYHPALSKPPNSPISPLTQMVRDLKSDGHIDCVTIQPPLLLRLLYPQDIVQQNYGFCFHQLGGKGGRNLGKAMFN